MWTTAGPTSLATVLTTADWASSTWAWRRSSAWSLARSAGLTIPTPCRAMAAGNAGCAGHDAGRTAPRPMAKPSTDNQRSDHMGASRIMGRAASRHIDHGMGQVSLTENVTQRVYRQTGRRANQ